jgi:hypothetical protein
VLMERRIQDNNIFYSEPCTGEYYKYFKPTLK